MDVVSAGVEEVKRERQRQLEEESKKDRLHYRAISRGGVRGESLE